MNGYPLGVIILILLIAAFIIFVLAAFNWTAPRINLVSLGLALLALAFIVERWPAH